MKKLGVQEGKARVAFTEVFAHWQARYDASYRLGTIIDR